MTVETELLVGVETPLARSERQDHERKPPEAARGAVAELQAS